MVMADSVRLQQVFWNILNNAAKFTPPEGTITVESVLSAKRTVIVRITDSGIGMTEADLNRVFDAFQQVESRQGGLGLGLTISRQLLARQHGSIRALSDGPGKGSTFEIELPLADPNAATVRAKTPAGSELKEAVVSVYASEVAGKKMRLLLVEDHGLTRNTLRALLVRRKFDVTVAGSVAEALSLIDQGEFDLIISDLGLPDGDGYHLLASVRAKLPDIRAVALSGYGTEEDRMRSAEAGFIAHLIKPISIDVLDKTIATILQPASSTA